MPEQMSGLKPTWQDQQWYEQQKEQERAQQFAGQTGIVGKALIGLGGFAADAFKENSDHPIARMARDMLSGLADADYMVTEGAKLTPGGQGEVAKQSLEISELATGVAPLAKGLAKAAPSALRAGVKDIQSLGVGQATLQTARDFVDKIPPMKPPMQPAFVGVTADVGLSRVPKMDPDVGPVSVMRYTDQELNTLGSSQKNQQIIDSVDPKYRYFTPESMQELQESMIDRQPAIDKAEARRDQLIEKLADARKNRPDKVAYYRSKLAKAQRKVNDLTSGPIEEIVPDNPQIYHSPAQSRLMRSEGGVDVEGNLRNELHHQTIENTEGGRLFLRKTVLKNNPQAAILMWEHMRRLGIVPGGGRRNMRALSGPQHTGTQGIHEFPAFKQWRGFFDKLPDDISLNNLFKKTEEFAASLDDTDKYLTTIGDPLLDRAIPEGAAFQNQLDRLIKEVQGKTPGLGGY